MNMKQPIIIMAALALGIGVNAQSLEDGVKMYRYERYESAKKILEPLAATNSAANYYFGLSELALDNSKEASVIFSRYAEDPANMSGLARVAYTSNNIDEGNKLTKIVADKAGKKAWEPLKYAADAINYTEGGNTQQAIDWYKESLKRNENVDTRIALGDAYQQIPAGGGEAMNNYEKVTAKEPNNSLAHSRIGALWYAARNYKLALESYEKAKNADPSNPIPYRELADAYFWTGKYNLAKQNIEKYIELSDKTIDDLVKYMNILYLGKDYEGAIKKAKELLGKGVKKPGVVGILAYSQLEMKDTAEALKNVRTYFQLQDTKKIFPDDFLRYGRIMIINSLPDSADYYFNKYVTVDTSKDKSEQYRKIAESFRVDAKDYAKAAEWYNKLITAYPNSPALDYFWRGTMYYYSKNYEGAAKGFEEMETKYPDQPSATYWRGRVAAAMDEEGKTCEGTEFYTKWLEKVGPSYDKKNDLMQAYQYLALCYYNKGDKENLKKYMDLIESIEPENAFLKQLKELTAKPGKSTKPGTK